MRGRDIALFRGQNSTGYASYNAVLQTLYSNYGTGGVWYDGVDPNYLTVNDDGTGGSPGDGVTFGRFTDRTGGGNHCVQATAASKMWYSATEGCSFFPNLTSPSSTAIHFAVSQSIPGGAAGTRNCTGAMIVDTQSLPFDSLPSSLVTAVTKAGTKFPIAKTFIAWRFSGTAHQIYVNGTLYSGGALTSAALRLIRLGTTITGGGNIFQNESSAFYSYALFNSAFSDADFLALRTAASIASGASTLSTTDAVLFYGDSNTQSSGSRGPHWTRAVAKSRTEPCYNFGRAGQGYYIMSLGLDTAYPIAKGSGKTAVVSLMGVNDNGQTTPYDNVEIASRGNCNYIRSNGGRSVVCTYPKTVGAAGTFCQGFNGLIRANYQQYADGISDLVTLTNMTNSGNTTYFPDGTHFDDLLTTTIKADINTQLDRVMNVPYVNFTAAPRDGSTSVASVYTDASTGSPTSWAWDFTNNGSTDSTSQNPSDTNSTPGQYTVKLSATNASGTGTRIRPLYIEVATPAAVTSGRVGRYSLNTGITQSGGFASVWADQDATLGNLVQATGANQPAVGVSGEIITDGAARYIQTAVGTLAADWSAVIRFKVITHTSGRRIIDGMVNNSNNLAFLTSPEVKFSSFGVGVSGKGVSVGNWQTVYIGAAPGVTAGNSPQCIWFDGDEMLMNANFSGAPAANGISLGAAFNGTLFSNCAFAEVHIFSARLTMAQIRQEFAFMRTVI